MFLSENSLPTHSQTPRRKTSQYLSSFIAITCAGVISGSSIRNDVPTPQSHEEKKEFFSPVVETRELVQNILVTKETERIAFEKQQERNMRSLSKIPMNDRGVFWVRIFRDLHLDTETMVNLIQRESSGLSQATSSKGAKGLMQVRDIVLDDMRGIEGVKRYGSLFLSLQNDTLEKMSQNDDKMKIVTLNKLVRSILLAIPSKDKEKLGNMLDEYNELIFALKIELYNPDINVILGSVYMRYLQQLSDSAQKYNQVDVVIQNLSDDDIEKINKLRRADKKNPFPSEYDFSALDVRKIIPLALYNVGPNAKDIKPGILYAIAILW